MMYHFKPTKMIGTLLLGTAFAGLAACDQQAEPVADVDESPTIETVVPESTPTPVEAASENPTENVAETAPAAAASEPERRPARRATTPPSRTPTQGSTPAPSPINTDLAEPTDPHAGHNMESMSDDDMEGM